MMHVALAIIRHYGRVLVQRRAATADHLPGYREFPGGKVQAGESPALAARREAEEETGLQVEIVSAWPPLCFHYPERTVCLHPFSCRISFGDPETLPDGAEWLEIAELCDDDFPAANMPLLAALRAEHPPEGNET